MAIKAEHRLFIDEWLATKDHISAYLKAFPHADRKTAATNGKRLLKNGKISAEIDKMTNGEPFITEQVPEEKISTIGRPTLYKDEYKEQVEKLCKLGATDKEIAEFFGIQESTLNLWKKSHPDFMESLKRGKVFADANVAERLFQRAMGFEHDSEEIKVVSDGKGEGSSIERVPIRKIYPPDTTAAIFWLKNRQKEKWRDGKDFTTNGDKLPQGPSSIVFLSADALTEEQIEKYLNANAGSDNESL